jgi:hypothetical protein
LVASSRETYIYQKWPAKNHFEKWISPFEIEKLATHSVRRSNHICRLLGFIQPFFWLEGVRTLGITKCHQRHNIKQNNLLFWIKPEKKVKAAIISLFNGLNHTYFRFFKYFLTQLHFNCASIRKITPSAVRDSETEKVEIEFKTKSQAATRWQMSWYYAT